MIFIVIQAENCFLHYMFYFVLFYAQMAKYLTHFLEPSPESWRSYDALGKHHYDFIPFRFFRLDEINCIFDTELNFMWPAHYQPVVVLMYLYSVFSLRTWFFSSWKNISEKLYGIWMIDWLRSCMSCIFCKNTCSFVETLGFFLSFVSKLFLDLTDSTVSP